MSFPIDEKTGIWLDKSGEGHGVDPLLCKAMISLLLKRQDIRTIADLGCGTGYYTKEINRHYPKLFCQGYDGNPYTKILTDNDPNCHVLDLSKEEYFDVDCILSLEIGEHIPKEYEQTFLDNVSQSKLVILSWSIPEFGGDGHFNSQPNEYIIDQMNKRNYVLNQKETNFLRGSCTAYPNTGWWFKETIMVFECSI